MSSQFNDPLPTGKIMHLQTLYPINSAYPFDDHLPNVPLQYESQNESLSTRLSEVEAKKQDLDSTLASLQEELGTLRTRERALESEGEGSYISRETSYVSREGSYVSGGERESSDERMAKHTIEMQRLKQEISSKEEEVVSIKR